MTQGIKIIYDARSKVSILQIQLMLKVVELQNITAAGRELGISGSFAARHISSLERALNVRLFQRTTRSIKLTEAGEHVLKWARDTITGFTELDDVVSAMTREPSGTVRLAINHYAAESYLPAVLSEFCLQYPEINLSVITTDKLVDLVAEGIDVAVHSGRIPDSSMVGLRVRDVYRVLCASPAYLERAGVPKTLEELSKHNFLVHSSNEPLNWFFRNGETTIGMSIRSRIEADNHNVLLQFVRRGLGIARLGNNIVDNDLKTGALVRLLEEYACVYPGGDVPGLWIMYPNRRLLYRTRVLVNYLSEKLIPAIY